MREATLTSEVLRVFREAGWLTHHMHSSRAAHYGASTKGFPDVLALRGARLVVAELKGHQADGRLGKLSPQQVRWLGAWHEVAAAVHSVPRAAGIEVYFWTPANLRSGEIDRIAA